MKEFYTVKEIADLLGVSKTTIQNATKELQLTHDKKVKNKYVYGIEKTRSIILFIAPYFDFSNYENLSPKNANQTPNNENQSQENDNQTPNNSQIPPNNDNQTPNNEKASSSTIEQEVIEELKRTIKIFENELKEKNEQLKAKDEQIKNLSEIIKGHLIINAQDKKLIEAESESETEDPQEPKKKGFFRNIFKKRGE